MATNQRTLLLPLLVAILASCGDDQDPTGAKQMWTKIHDQKYEAWARAPGYASRKPTSAPHSDAVEIFVNNVVATALAGTAINAWPDGSLIVKDGYKTSGSLAAVAAMEKRGSTWFWAEWDADGTSIYSGDPSLCTGCHGSGADMIRAFGFPP